MRQCKITTALIAEWFEGFNWAYFDNKLKTPKFELCNTKTILGQYVGREKKIRVSTYYDATEKQYKNTLLHEMVHLWQHQTMQADYLGLQRGQKRRSVHGDSFKRMAAVINRDGWDIERTGTHGKRAEDTKAKSRGDRTVRYLVTWKNQKNIKCFCFISAAHVFSCMQYVTEHYPENYYDVKVYAVPSLARIECFSTNRNRTAYYYYAHYSKAVDEAILNGKLVKTYRTEAVPA